MTGSEFKAEVHNMLVNDYGLKTKPISVRSPQANSIVERVHQAIGNMIRTFEMYDNERLDESDPWSGLLAAVMFATRATYHTMLKATPMQLVFGQDAIINMKLIADWEFIHQRKQRIIHQNNLRENSKRKSHKYNIGDKVLQKAAENTKY